MLTILLSMFLAAVPITVDTEVQADTVDYIFYVDGERVESETARAIKLADIKTITTIKGNAATENYGAEAGNSVIVIKTKKGAKDSKKKEKTTHEYVDLGLSVKWATCNVGADKPEDYGDYYAWGEVMPKVGYTWMNYRFFKEGTSNNDVTLSKYSSDMGFGVNNRKKDKLVAEDDVAHLKWGDNWRMPTRKEIDELRNNCTWTWTIIDGVAGYKVTSNKKGYKDRSIFLPAAGYKDIGKDVDVGLAGHYWTSSLSFLVTTCADILYCFPNSRVTSATAYRYYGLPVRPVCP